MPEYSTPCPLALPPFPPMTSLFHRLLFRLSRTAPAGNLDRLVVFSLLQPVHTWKHQFSSVCLSVVHEQAFGARMPSYRAIQDLDKKVRNFYVPPSLRVPGFGGAKMDTELTYPIQLTMQRYIGFAIKEISECCWAYF